MAAVRWWKYAYLALASKPKAERQMYRLVKNRQVCQIVEVGIGSLDRAAALVQVAQRYAGRDVSYTGIDWFDAQPETQPALSLKQAHRRLQAAGGKIRLVPGNPAQSLAAVANTHRGTGLMLISAAVADGELEPAWFFVPRMLTARSIVLREQAAAEGRTAWTSVSLDEIARRVQKSGMRRAA